MDKELAVIRQDLAQPAALLATTDLANLIKTGTPKEVRLTIAELKAGLEEHLVSAPDDYPALVMLGEINLRVGLVHQARDLLYRASLQQPPSWEAFQRTSYLLRRAEEQVERSFPRFAGAPPRMFLRRLARKTRGLFQRSSPPLVSEVS